LRADVGCKWKQLAAADASVKLANEVTFKRMKDTIERLRDTPAEKLSPLANILLGHSKPTIAPKLENLKFIDDTLNDSQKDAVRFALAAPELALIHGPPGVSPCPYPSDPRRAKHTP